MFEKKSCSILRDQIALSTDIIVGFCGEEEEDHQGTLDLLRTAGYDQAFLFAYSKRDKTHAARHLQVLHRIARQNGEGIRGVFQFLPLYW